jgi:proline dehydrogenase
MLRHMFLFLSQNKTLTKLAKAYGSRLGARRFVAGDTIESAVRTIKKLNQSGLCTTKSSRGRMQEGHSSDCRTPVRFRAFP